jgi:2-C-methyl-D-erythritol 2,4-cyclodiphosphate synthase
MRIGFGYDAHALVLDRKLVLGGVVIPYKYGLDGYSDADVVIHALMDALLGAAALGDIGIQFPNTDESYKDIDSMILLRRVVSLLDKAGYYAVNCDVTLIAQYPKIAPYSAAMCENIAGALGCGTDAVSVKATTEEHLGFTGSCQGMKCCAVALIEKKGV